MDFIIIGNAWEMGRLNPICTHRVAAELVRRGHRVLWVEGSGMRRPSLRSSRDRMRMLRKVGAAFRGVRRAAIEQIPGAILQQDDGRQGGEPVDRGGNTGYRKTDSSFVWVLSPLFLPFPSCGVVRRINGLIGRVGTGFWKWVLGFHAPVLINTVPTLAYAMPRARGGESDGGRRDRAGAPVHTPQTSVSGCGHGARLGPCCSRAVYYCIDRWDAYPGYDAHVMAEMDRRCCEKADVVLASSGVLADRCRRFNENVHLLPHGVDHPLFSRALQGQARPDDLPAGRVAGFFGSLSAWLDQDLLLELARRVPECEIVLIGRADVPVDRLRKARNIHLLGARPFRQLPGYLAHFDVGLIPYVVNDLTMAVNPTKLREMLAGGCPVVASGLPEVRPYVGRGATVCGTVEAFADAVAKLVREPLSPMERLAISRGVAQETWEARVEEMLGWVGSPQTSRRREWGRTHP